MCNKKYAYGNLCVPPGKVIRSLRKFPSVRASTYTPSVTLVWILSRRHLRRDIHIDTTSHSRHHSQGSNCKLMNILGLCGQFYTSRPQSSNSSDVSDVSSFYLQHLVPTQSQDVLSTLLICHIWIQLITAKVLFLTTSGGIDWAVVAAVFVDLENYIVRWLENAKTPHWGENVSNLSWILLGLLTQSNSKGNVQFVSEAVLGFLFYVALVAMAVLNVVTAVPPDRNLRFVWSSLQCCNFFWTQAPAYKLAEGLSNMPWKWQRMTVTS